MSMGHGGGGGAAAAGHAESTRVAAETLARGGNACDALIAGAIASWVAEPTVSGPCGGGFLLVHEAAAGRTTLLDAFVAIPAGDRPPPEPFDVEFGTAVQRFWIGVGTCAVPGTAAGVGELHRRFGSRPWAELVAPAIALARDGVTVTPQHETLHDLLAGLLVAMPAGRRVFAPDGELLRHGATIRQSDLADTLERLAERGVDDLYRGHLAAVIVAFMADHGAELGAADLAAYRVIERQPVACTYRAHTVLGNPAPSSGGTLIAHALAVANQLPAGADPLGADRARLLAAVLSEADAQRTPAFAAALAAERDGGVLADEVIADAVERVRAGVALPPSSGPVARGTTHISVVDARGNVAAMTSSTGCGSGVFVADTGLHLNNMLGEEDLATGGGAPPGSRLTSMMSPTLVRGPDGYVAAAGSSGSARIRSALVRVISALVDDRLPAQAAIDLPRLHPGPIGLDVEPGFADEAVAALGAGVVRWPAIDIYFGGAQVAERRHGVFGAGGDPRRGGAAIVVD